MGDTFSLLPSGGHYHAVATTIARKYNMPGVFYLDLWPLAWPHVVVTDPNVALDITVTRNHPKHPAIGHMIDPLIGYDNIVSADGPRWKHLHKMVSPAFSIMHITQLRPMVAAEVMKYRSILHEKAKLGEPFRLEDYVHHLTFDVISAAAIGQSLDAQTKGSPALEHFRAMTRAYMKSRESFNYISNFFANRERDAERRKLDALMAVLIKQRFELVKRK
jgi:cytochrome P450